MYLSISHVYPSEQGCPSLQVQNTPAPESTTETGHPNRSRHLELSNMSYLLWATSAVWLTKLLPERWLEMGEQLGHAHSCKPAIPPLVYYAGSCILWQIFGFCWTPQQLPEHGALSSWQGSGHIPDRDSWLERRPQSMTRQIAGKIGWNPLAKRIAFQRSVHCMEGRASPRLRPAWSWDSRLFNLRTCLVISRTIILVWQMDGLKSPCLPFLMIGADGLTLRENTFATPTKAFFRQESFLTRRVNTSIN